MIRLKLRTLPLVLFVSCFANSSRAQIDSFTYHYERFAELKSNSGPSDSVTRMHLNKALHFMDTTIADVRNGNVYYNLAREVYWTGDHNEALKLFFKASHVFGASGDSCKYRDAMYNIGAVLYSLGDDLGAMRYYTQFERVRSCPLDTGKQLLFHYNMALIFDDISNQSEADNHFRRVVSLNDSTPKGMYYSLLSQLALNDYQSQGGDTLAAIAQHHEILSAAHIGFFEPDIFFYGYGELGDFYLGLRQFDSARRYYNLAREISDSLQWPEFELTCVLNEAELYLVQGQLKAAEKLALEALKVTRERDYSMREMDVLNLLVRVDTTLGRWESAFRKQRRVSEIGDSLQIAKASFTYLVHEISEANKFNKELGEDVAEAQQDVVKAQIEARRKNKMLITAGILLVVFAFLLVVIATQRRKMVRLNRFLVESNQNKDKVVATLTHDVRAPLVAVEGLITLLRKDIVTPEEKEQLLNSLESGMVNLKNNVESMLDWSLAQLKTSRPNRVNISVYEVFSDARSYGESLVNGSNIAIDVEVNPIDLQVTMDRGHLLVILRNLLGNAIKFSKDNSRVILRAWEEEGNVVMSVQDWGQGIREEDQPKILGDEVYTKESKNGYGLGLRLVKEYVKLNKGKILLTSEYGEGTTFTLVFSG